MTKPNRRAGPAIRINLCHCPLHISWAQLVKQQMLWSVGGGPRWNWRRTSMAVGEERARDVNLDGWRAVSRGPQRRACGGGARGGGARHTAWTSTAGMRWRRTWRRSRHRWVCGGEMIGLGFRGSGTLKKRIVTTGGVDYISRPFPKPE
jgi:hypothetical protein